jgi:hypothetical protein
MNYFTRAICITITSYRTSDTKPRKEGVTFWPTARDKDYGAGEPVDQEKRRSFCLLAQEAGSPGDEQKQKMLKLHH